MKTLYIVSLGCAKNLVDSEVMLGLLDQRGYSVVETPEEAGLLLVNTCGFIGSAVEEAVDEIVALAEYKKKDPIKKLVVTGCLVQRYGAKLAKELPEVDMFVGTDGFQNIVELLEGKDSPSLTMTPTSSFLMNSSLPRKISTPAHRAYLKITEGCDNRCSYCLIPSIRGRLRSREIDDLVIEARGLEKAGVKELTLVAQDLLAYGMDRGQGELTELLAAILGQTNIPWLRLLYLHPARLKRDFLRFMAENPRILPYFDIPVQHVSNRILQLMNRPYKKARLEELIGDIRQILPESAIRTTLMVGFPGETEAEFGEIAEFLKKHLFDHVGVFTYANEEGCKAQGLPNHCSEEVKETRRDGIMELQAAISLEKQQAYIGKTVQVLVEGVSRETDLLLEGRTRYQAPDIDGCVYITAGTTNPGDLTEVIITEAHPYDLVGEIVG